MYIYKITNKLNGKFYIGKTTGSIESRFKEHLNAALKYSRGEYKHNSHLYEAINLYGKDNFIIEILDVASTIKDLDTKERYGIEKLDSRNNKIGYNLAAGGSGGDTGSKLSKEQKATIGDAKRRNKQSTLCKTIIANRSNSDKDRIKENIKEGVTKSGIDANARKEELSKRSKGNKYGSKKYYCILKESNIVKQFNSKEDAANGGSNSVIAKDYLYKRTNIRWGYSLIDKYVHEGKIEYSTKGGNHKMYNISNIEGYRGEYGR